MIVGPVEVMTDRCVTFAVTVEPGRVRVETSVNVLTVVATLETVAVEITVVSMVRYSTDVTAIAGATGVDDVTALGVSVVVFVTVSGWHVAGVVIVYPYEMVVGTYSIGSTTVDGDSFAPPADTWVTVMVTTAPRSTAASSWPVFLSARSLNPTAAKAGCLSDQAETMVPEKSNERRVECFMVLDSKRV